MMWIELDRQFDNHPRVFPFHTRNSEPSPMVSDNAVADAETKACSLVRRFRGEEWVFDLLYDGGGNSGAMIAKRCAHMRASLKYRAL